MHKSTGGAETCIDALVCMEGEFKIVGESLPGELAISLEMAYFDSDRGISLGRCNVREGLLSKDTQEALRRFLELAEEDFANIVFYNQDPQAEEEPEYEPQGGIVPAGLGDS